MCNFGVGGKKLEYLIKYILKMDSIWIIGFYTIHLKPSIYIHLSNGSNWIGWISSIIQLLKTIYQPFIYLPPTNNVLTSYLQVCWLFLFIASIWCFVSTFSSTSPPSRYSEAVIDPREAMDEKNERRVALGSGLIYQKGRKLLEMYGSSRLSME